MPVTIDLRLYASLASHMPANAQHYPITPGITVISVLQEIRVPLEDVKLIFVNGVRAEAQQILTGGERVGIFPPIGGG